MTTSRFSQALLTWHKSEGRKNLPWQQPATPYRVWVSEIMLQQTQVKTVIPFFERFMARFPALHLLAEAPRDEVLHLWAGLGYYARAKNLHASAGLVCAHFQGQLPANLATLQTLPGIGRSTAGAILSLAFQQRAVILDANVKRVLARVHCVAGASNESATLKKLWRLANSHTPHKEKEVATYTQAIMDLGALVCTRVRPHCARCPVRTQCKAYKKGVVETYPESARKKTRPVKKGVALFQFNRAGALLLERQVKLWQGLYNVPIYQNLGQVRALLANHGVQQASQGPIYRHSLTHFHFDLTPVTVRLVEDSRLTLPNQIWYPPQSGLKVGLAGPVKKLLAQAQNPEHWKAL